MLDRKRFLELGVRAHGNNLGKPRNPALRAEAGVPPVRRPADNGADALRVKGKAIGAGVHTFGYEHTRVWEECIGKSLSYDPFKVKFTHSPLMNEIHRKKLDTDEDLKLAIRNNFTIVFLKDLLWRMDNNKNFIIIVYGATGSGKSTIAQFIGSFVNDYCSRMYGPKVAREQGRAPIFDSSNVCFSRTEFLKRMQSAVRYETIMFDEDDKSLLHLGGFREQDEMDKMEKSIRGAQNNFIFCSPVLEEHTAHYTIKAFDINPENRLNRSIIYIKDDDMWGGMNVPEGHIITPHFEVGGYQEKKSKFIENIKNRTIRDRYEEYDEVAKCMLEKYPSLADGRHQKQLKAVMRREYPRFISEEYDDIMASMMMFKVQAGQMENRTLGDFSG